MTQVEFARDFNISKGTIAMWEINQRQPDNETMAELADYFEVSVDYLLGREQKKTSPAPPVISEKYGDVLVALNDGDKNLTQDDVDDIVRFIEFKKSMKK